jgi:hypothetical protein
MKGRTIMRSLHSVQEKVGIVMGLSVLLCMCQHISVEHRWKIVNEYDMKAMTLQTTQIPHFQITVADNNNMTARNTSL